MTDNSGIAPWPPERSSISARLQSLRDLVSSERHSEVRQRALDALNQEMSERTTDRGLAGSERRIRDYDAHLQTHEQSTIHEPSSSNDYPGSENTTTRRRLPAHLQRIVRARNSQNEVLQTNTYDAPTSPRRPSLPNDLADPIPDQYHPANQAVRDQRYRAKRRKLDDGTFDDGSRVVSYGDAGRVVPGPLRMQIVSCDGEEYDEPNRGIAQYILQDDALVYSTRSNRCNLLIKHAGGMPFSLTKLVFRAPRDGYEAPAQEGMLFVAMDDDGLVEKTSPYDFKFSPKGYRHHYPRRHDVYRPSQEYMNSTRSPLRSIDRSRYLRDPYAHRLWFHSGESSPEIDTSLVPGFEVSVADPAESEESQSFSPRSPRQWHTEMFDYPRRIFADRYRYNLNDNLSYVELSGTSEESEDEESTSGPPRPRDDPDLRTPLALDRQSLDRRRRTHERDETNLPALTSASRPLPDDWQELHRYMNSRRPDSSRADPGPANRTHLTRSPSNINKTLESTSTVSANQVLPADILPPHARFSISRHKSSIAINFAPPVSGRYILIKLWAACPNASIDIQSVVAHGYGGPRFFPATDLR